MTQKLSESEKLQLLLNQKSSSRLGKINKRTQGTAIRQLMNEDKFTKDLEQKIQREEKQAKMVYRFKKERNLSQEVAEKIEEEN